MKERLQYRWYHWRNTWLQYQSTLVWLHRKSELERLVAWARRKRLGVLRFYKKQLLEAESTIATKAIRFPGVMKWARFAFWINRLISVEPQYYPKGYASKYRVKP